MNEKNEINSSKVAKKNTPQNHLWLVLNIISATKPAKKLHLNISSIKILELQFGYQKKKDRKDEKNSWKIIHITQLYKFLQVGTWINP